MPDAIVDPVDAEALQRCIELTRKDRALGAAIEGMLQERPWNEVATFCSFSCQMDALNLKPWQSPPCWREDDRDPQTKEMADRLRAVGLSIYEPSPLEALAAKEKPKRR